MVAGKTRNSELASLTVSMLLSLAYLITVCWIVPMIPMVIVLMYGLPFSVFLALWLTGSAISGLAFYCFYRTRR